MLDERLGKVHFWLLFIGFQVTFLVQHWLGNQGNGASLRRLPALGRLPRRSTWCRASARSSWASRRCSSSTTSTAPGATRRRSQWMTRGAGEARLEWATSCPPPRHNFTSLPPIRSERPAFDLHHPDLAQSDLPVNKNALDGLVGGPEISKTRVAPTTPSPPRLRPALPLPCWTSRTPRAPLMLRTRGDAKKLDGKIFLYRMAFYALVAVIYGSSQRCTCRAASIDRRRRACLHGLHGVPHRLLLHVHGQARGRPAGGRPGGRPGDADPEYGFFSPHSWWPLALGASFAIIAYGWVFAAWVVAFGVASLLISLWGFVFEYYRRGPRTLRSAARRAAGRRELPACCSRDLYFHHLLLSAGSLQRILAVTESLSMIGASVQMAGHRARS